MSKLYILIWCPEPETKQIRGAFTSKKLIKQAIEELTIARGWSKYDLDILPVTTDKEGHWYG